MKTYITQGPPHYETVLSVAIIAIARNVETELEEELETVAETPDAAGLELEPSNGENHSENQDTNDSQTVISEGDIEFSEENADQPTE